MTAPIQTDFDEWIAGTHGEVGDFTMLFVLVRITETTVEPLRSAWLHVVGDETRWPEMVSLFAGAGVAWSGAVFFRAGREGLVRDAEARARLGALTRKLHEDRTLIREGEFFNADGLRLQLEELKPH
ncbi:hypothetical protein [Pseudoroseomonas ludipueritiae]|uniref:Uncharacterized protein n=1 Tax=Pseudoroseomonas ludipueritiae TaxID=198093 RepID=A0ABR7R232_9PROT|nr:hypothetical protein [Pseudoroseomonas ludipueritiae]MBC9175708.1 hypothetical protein [Pseudoroseomonas ludipueritiae]